MSRLEKSDARNLHDETNILGVSWELYLRDNRQQRLGGELTYLFMAILLLFENTDLEGLPFWVGCCFSYPLSKCLLSTNSVPHTVLGSQDYWKQDPIVSRVEERGRKCTNTVGNAIGEIPRVWEGNNSVVMGAFGGSERALGAEW